jgi:hypothetical protein
VEGVGFPGFFRGDLIREIFAFPAGEVVQKFPFHAIIEILKLGSPEKVFGERGFSEIPHTNCLTKKTFSGKVVRFFPGDKRITDSYTMEEKCPR